MRQGPGWVWVVGIVVALIDACLLRAFVAEGRFVETIGLAFTLPLAAVAALRVGGRWGRFWVGTAVAAAAMLVVGLACERWPSGDFASVWQYGCRIGAITLVSLGVFSANGPFVRSHSVIYVLAASAFAFQLPVALACGAVSTRLPRLSWDRGRVRFHLSVRQVMAATAAVAVVLAAVQEGSRLWTLRQLYLGQAERYGYWEVRVRGALSLGQEITYYSIQLPRGPTPSPERLDQMKQQAEYYGRMRAKYELAASRPWRPVSPDPSPPGV